ncbi:MAG: hypothetical protein SCH71_03845 [Desulfobulbaceae bacterium]|nr:hypothetical protein [Desulfobulbaceae bacterium]
MQNYDLSGLSSEERQWFLKFINGTFFADGWQEIAEDILGKIPAHVRPSKEEKLNELGNKIGREWCKDNDVRKIDTAMLKKWGRLLRSTSRENPHVLASVIDYIDEEVNTLID